MRISVYAEDKLGYKTYLDGLNDGYSFTVLLNGKPVDNIVIADSVLGYLKRSTNKMDDDYNYIYEELWGRVSIYKNKG